MQNLVLDGRLGKIIENLEKGPVVPLCLITEVVEGLVGSILTNRSSKNDNNDRKKFFFRQDRLQKEEIQKTLSPKGTGLDLSEKISYNQ
jgi:hypothetical protein